MPKTAYVMVGGFLGAGKTTAVIRMARFLSEQGKTAGLITNDQSFGLADTALARSQGFNVEEITGGCFCCRFNSLMEAADKLSVQQRPDVFIAEPVGSCTDLRAAVSYPLRRLYGEDFEIAPLSVLVDPVRALRVLGLEPGRSFSEKVLYVYDRQLAEADLILINKVDTVDGGRVEKLKAALEERYRQAEVLTISARRGDGLEHWFGRIAEAAMGEGAAPDVDYEIYAAGEALLGWMNATVQLSAETPFDGNRTLETLAAELAQTVGESEIAHLKMTLTPDEEGGDIAVANLVRNDGAVELAHRLKSPLASGELIVNLRAEEDPDKLRDAALDAFRAWEAEQAGRRAAVEHIEHFRPAKPTPTYRMAAL